MLGVIAAVPTPVSPGFAPQKDLFLEHCNWLLANGCDGLNILGSTGEANSFSPTVRAMVMGWAAGNLDLSKLMVGTGTPSLAETIELTAAADGLGYPVALVLPPYYYKPVTDQGLTDWYRELHRGLGNKKIKIYFYNFPQMTGLNISAAVIENLHRNWPGRFAGIKDSSGDLGYCRDLSERMPDLAVFPSSEVSLGEAEKSGFAGCISATANQTAPLCARLWAGRADPRPDLVDEISDLRNRIAATALIPAIKYLVSKRTMIADWENMVPPFSALTKAQKAELDQIADQLF